VLQKWKKNPEVYLLGEGVKDFRIWVEETSYYFRVLRELEINSRTDYKI
jgi:hypothetical protein